MPPLALIAGPTASGKSALALKLAEQAEGTIVNADSAQVYRELRIVSARPGPEEEDRVPHRLYGYRDGATPCSAADWAADARQAIREAHAAGRLPILVGGTGLYVRTLLEGIAPVPDINPEIRREVRSLSIQDTYSFLIREDPETAGRLLPSDSSRIARALEVVRSTGRPLSDWQREKKGGISREVKLLPLLLLPPRNWLHQRCDRRFETMMTAEGVEEIRQLLARNLDPSLPVMRAIGVREIASFISGQLGREETLAKGKAATRQYAKRQYTWFGRQPPGDWPRFEAPLEPERMDEALSFLRQIA